MKYTHVKQKSEYFSAIDIEENIKKNIYFNQSFVDPYI